MTYDVILADPPWPYRVWTKKESRTADAHYDTLTLKQIEGIELPAEENAALFLWATAPCMGMAMYVMASWGFNYKTIAFTWIKHNLHPLDAGLYSTDYVGIAKHSAPIGGMQVYGLSTGLGHYTRANAEFCLLGIRGKMPVEPARRPKSVIATIRGAHSAKPLEVMGRIGFMYPQASKLEMFARSRVSGWHSWGNEVDSDVDIEVPAP